MYLGIDLGTSGVKLLLMDGGQNVVASSHAPLSVSHPHSGWSEQVPSEWIEATKKALDALKVTNGPQLAAVKGIGLSGQMHGATLLDRNEEVLRPCMLWNDTRSHAEAAALDAGPCFREVSGNIVFPGFTAPKLAWLKNNEPGIFDKVAKVLLPKDYLRLWLTGEHVSEMSDASGTSWLDVGARQWSEDLLAATDLSKDHMPRLVEGSEASGTMRKELAERWGMGEAVVAGGAGDNAASAAGLGTVEAGSAFVSLGTSGVLFAANAAYQPNPASAVHAFCHALPNVWHQMGVILSATDALNWWSGVAGADAQTLTGELDHTIDVPSGLVFLPYLSGERTPHNDAAIRGSFVGLDHAHDRRAMTQAVLEGVSFALRDSLEALRVAGTRIDRVMAVGGGTASRTWLDILANALNLPVDLPQDGDYGAAFGAARLGLIAAENVDPAAICTQPSIDQSFEPDPNLHDGFEAAYQRYRALYPAISGVTS